VLGLAQVQAVHVPTGARSVAVRHAHRMRGCCQLRQEATQPVTTGSWTATTQRGASIQSDLGCVSTPNIADHTLQCTGWRPKQKQRCQTLGTQCVVAVSFSRELSHGSWAAWTRKQVTQLTVSSAQAGSLNQNGEC
jgi:hypothetical protein